MMERARSVPFERTHAFRKSDHTDYIKICVADEGEAMEGSDMMRRSGEVREGQRFTFNSLPQDFIK